MNLSRIYESIVLLHPRVEVALRQFYWKNYSKLAKFRPKRNSAEALVSKIDFNKILDFIESGGYQKGGILIVHSSYKSLKPTALSADEMINGLLGIVGDSGTLVMPVIRSYEEDEVGEESLRKDMSDIISVYNVSTTKIHTGYLPICFKNRPGSVTSRFPLNTVTAFGPHANAMVENNLDGDFLSPNGKNSAWKYCLDNNAYIVGLGVDIAHSLTMIHVNEEAYGDWPIIDWFRKRKFKIIDGTFTKDVIVNERKPIWGSYYYLERTLKRDLICNGILSIKIIDGIEVSILNSKQLIDYLRSRRESGYPYCIPKKFFKDNINF